MDILEKIKKVETLIERAGSEGERQSAILARARLEKSKILEEIEYSISTQDIWHKKLFVAICHKYGLNPYRYYRQKHTTVMVKIGKQFIDEIVWPEYLKYAQTLEALLDDIAAQVISKIHKDEAEIVINGEIEAK